MILSLSAVHSRKSFTGVDASDMPLNDKVESVGVIVPLLNSSVGGEAKKSTEIKFMQGSVKGTTKPHCQFRGV